MFMMKPPSWTKKSFCQWVGRSALKGGNDLAGSPAADTQTLNKQLKLQNKQQKPPLPRTSHGPASIHPPSRSLLNRKRDPVDRTEHGAKSYSRIRGVLAGKETRRLLPHAPHLGQWMSDGQPETVKLGMPAFTLHLTPLCPDSCLTLHTDTLTTGRISGKTGHTKRFNLPHLCCTFQS